MNFLGPSFLWLLPLIALPVVFHLAYRLKRRRVEFPSLVFFQRLEPRLQARRRLRDLLVLLLRCLVIAFVVLALARPLWQGWGGGGAASIVLVIDNSASMGAPTADAKQTRLAAALAAAGALVADLGGRDRAGVVTAVVDPLVPALAEPTADRSRLRAVLDQVRTTQAAASPAAALARAALVLKASTAPRREIHVFTDLQEHDWAAAPAAAIELPPATVVRVHRIPAGDASADAALAELKLLDRARLAGRPTGLRVALSNASGSDAAVTLSLADDAGHRLSQSATVPARGALELGLAVPAAQAGTHWARVWIEGDRFAGDDDGYVAFASAGKRPVALVGVRRELGALPLALAPAADGSLSGLSLQSYEPARLADALASKPALLALTWEACTTLDAAAQQAVRTYIEQGGRCAVVPRAGVPAAPLPALPWLGLAVEAPLHAEAGRPLVALDPRAELLRELAGADGSVRFANARIMSALPLKLDAGWKPVLGLDDGRPLLAARSLGRGSVYASGIAFSPSWSTLPLTPAFLAIAQAMALPPASDDGVVRLVAGEAARLPEGLTGGARIRSIAGAALDWQGQASDLPPFARAGVYLVSAGGHDLLAAVRADPGEGRPACLTGSSVPAFGGLAYQVDEVRSPEQLVSSWRSGRTGIDLMPWLIALAIAAALAEGWIANRALVRPRAVVAADPMQRGAAA